MRTKVPKMLTKVVNLAVQAVFDALVIEYDSSEYKAALAASKKTSKTQEDLMKKRTSEEHHRIFSNDKHFMKHCEEKNKNLENVYFYRKASKLKRMEANFNAYTKRLKSIFPSYILQGAPQQITIPDDLRKRLELAYYLAPIMVQIRVEVVFKYKTKLRGSMIAGPLESFRQQAYVAFLSPDWLHAYARFEEKWLNGSDLYHRLSEMEFLEHDFHEYMRFYRGIATSMEAYSVEFNDVDGPAFVADAEKFFQLVGGVMEDKHLTFTKD